MTFVSYSQNYEDIMLWRALKHLDNGFYIDLGAWLPETDSVTKAFYDRGWRGINIEPNPKFFNELCKHRPRDINLNIAIDEDEGELILNIVGDSGMSTCVDSLVESYDKEGWLISRITVNAESLISIFEKYVPHKQDVHFLKIDIEGYEKKVVNSNDWERFRPWIIVIESILPKKQIEIHKEWEYTLIESGYAHVYSDGLNRFYLLKEKI